MADSILTRTLARKCNKERHSRSSAYFFFFCQLYSGVIYRYFVRPDVSLYEKSPTVGLWDFILNHPTLSWSKQRLVSKTMRWPGILASNCIPPSHVHYLEESCLVIKGLGSKCCCFNNVSCENLGHSPVPATQFSEDENKAFLKNSAIKTKISKPLKLIHPNKNKLCFKYHCLDNKGKEREKDSIGTILSQNYIGPRT